MKANGWFRELVLKTGDDWKIIFIRLIIGLIFISEGIQKFLYIEALGPGFFRELGFSNHLFWANFTGVSEILFGALILLGLLTRLSSIPLLIILATAFFTTKLPVLMTKGIWTFFHQNNADFALVMLLIVLIIYGGGKWSVDSYIWEHPSVGL